jgi:hypothetical protein
MRNFVVYTICWMALAAAGCSDREQEARARLDDARLLYEKDEWVAAKNAIDSIRALYPEQTKVLREALGLMRSVELKEAERNIAYCDSLLPVRQEEARRKVSGGFVFEKDTAYGGAGAYLRKRQTVERNVERSYLRCGVSEEGEMYLASVYFGSRPVGHTGLRVSTGDGLSAETASIPYDGGVNYRFEDGGNTSEIVTYKGENGLDAVRFIYANAGKRIRAEYTGGRRYAIDVGEADKEDIVATYDLASVLSEVRGLAAEREKAVRKKAYLEGKLNQ